MKEKEGLLWNGSEKHLIQIIKDSNILRGTSIARLQLLLDLNAKKIPKLHKKLSFLSQNNLSLFEHLRENPNDPELIDKLQESKLAKALIKRQIKIISQEQLEYKYLIKLLQKEGSW